MEAEIIIRDGAGKERRHITRDMAHIMQARCILEESLTSTGRKEKHYLRNGVLTIYSTNNWDIKVHCGLSKAEIRELSEGIFREAGGALVFTTLCDGIIKEDGTTVFRIELDNASARHVTVAMGERYAEVLSRRSGTHTFKFTGYDQRETMEDISGYEPGKIPMGTFGRVRRLYLLMEAYPVVSGKRKGSGCTQKGGKG